MKLQVFTHHNKHVLITISQRIIFGLNILKLFFCRIIFFRKSNLPISESRIMCFNGIYNDYWCEEEYLISKPI